MELVPVEGYNFKNYDTRRGINVSGEDVVSNAVVEQVIDCVLGGYADTTIRDMLYRAYGMSSYAARFIIGKAHKDIHSRTEKQTDNMLEKQNSRLFRLYRDALDNDDRKTALAILAEINKLNKLYVTKVEVSSDVFTLDLGLDK